ncbi:MAG TPA: hypothetical protein VFB34_10650, partial [Chloroflexota bacterium]|nr:hypothetical protein [Chloroflexota bacterium]
MSLAQVGGEELSRSFLSLVESGRSRISLRALAIVAERLDTPISHFLQDEDVLRARELGLEYAEVELEKGNAVECIKTIEAEEAYAGDARAQWLRGRAYAHMEDEARAGTILRNAARLAPSEVDPNLAAEILYSLGRTLYNSSSYEEAIETWRTGLALVLHGPSNPALQARFHIVIGHMLYVQNQPAQAIQQYERAQELYGALYDLGNVGSVFSAMSLASRKSGDLDAALKYSKQSVAAFRLKRDWKLVARELNNMAMRYQERGELETASERAEEAVERAHEIGATDIEAHSRGTLALIRFQRGDMDGAQREAIVAEELAGKD